MSKLSIYLLFGLLFVPSIVFAAYTKCYVLQGGTVCLNATTISSPYGNITMNSTANNYPTNLTVNQTGNSYSVVLGRFGLGSLMGNFSVSGTGGGIGYVNTTGANFNSTNWFIRMINDTTAQAAGVSCNAGDAISTLSNNSVCTSFITPAALAAFSYISSAPNVNVTGFTGSGTTVQLNLSNGSILNATTTGGTGTGNISGSLVAGEGVYAYNSTYLTTNKILYVEPNNAADLLGKANKSAMVFIPQGTYNIASTLSIGNNTTLIGTGYGTYINYSGASNAIAATQGTNIRLYNFRVNHNHPTAAHAIRFNNITNLTIQGINSEDAGHHNIWVNGSQYVLITDNNVVGAGKDTLNDGVGILVGSSRGKITISNNFVTDTGYHGIQGHDNDAEVIIEGNNIEDIGNVNAAGSFILIQTNAKRAVISNNIGKDSNAGGIGLDTTNDTTITGNVINDVGQDGIGLINANNTVVSSNTIKNITRAGIYARGSSFHTIISSNSIASTNSNGIWFSDVSYFTVTGNNVYDQQSQSSGIIVEGTTSTDFSINGNLVQGGKYGIRLNGVGQDRYSVTNNIGYTNNGSFLDVVDQSQGTYRYISGNIITNGTAQPTVTTIGSGSIYPSINSTYILGNDSNVWNYIYTNNSRSYGNIEGYGNLTIGSTAFKVDTTNGRIGINATPSTGAILTIGDTSNTPRNITIAGGRLQFYYDGSFGTIYNGGSKGFKVCVNDNCSTPLLQSSQSNNYLGINRTAPRYVLDVVGNASITESLIVNGSNVCLQNGTNCPAGGSGNVTATNGTAGFVGVFSSSSNLVAMLINSTMIGDAAVNATHLYTSNGGSSGQVLTLNSTGGLNWSTPSTGTSTSGGNASINGNGVFGTYTIQKNTTEIVSGNLTENGVLRYPNNATFSKYLNIGGTVFPYNQPRRFKIAELEFLRGGTNTGGIESLGLSTFSGGASTGGTGDANHPGVLILQDSATALGGSGIFSDVAAFLLGGGENFTVIFQIRSGQTGNSTTKIGFHDVGGAGWATDGCYWSFDNWGTGTGGPTTQAEPKCASNSAQTKTTNFTYTNNTWYVGNIYVNPNATNVTFTIMNETGGILQSDSITSNIPTAAGRVTGAGVIFTQNTTSAAAAGVYLDYLSLVINRELNRGLQQ